MIFSLESNKMTALLPNEIYQTEQLLKKKFFDQMICLESDKMTFTFYVIISNRIPNSATFVKEVF